MARKKKLKVNGSSIDSFSVKIKKIKSKNTIELIDAVFLEINVGDDFYEYDIRVDWNFKDVSQIRGNIEKCLKKAQEDYLNVEIHEDVERNYLSFMIQTTGVVKYSGRRV